MLRRNFLVALPALLVPGMALAHSPWGQYVVYRQKHLLVLSTRDDAESYPYSKRLVEAINKGAPEASARPARAINLDRAYNLLRSDQFQFALLSPGNIEAMRSATGPFSGKPAVDLRTVYKFEGLEFVVRADFPNNLVSIVTDAVLSNIAILPGALRPEEVLQSPNLHAGAQEAIQHQ
jgi:hypothetical protein